jgi:AmiR/NasT family two-component response regulator
MIAERLHVSVDDAFDALRHHARNNNQRLADVARNIVDTTLDPNLLRPPSR